MKRDSPGQVLRVLELIQNTFYYLRKTVYFKKKRNDFPVAIVHFSSSFSNQSNGRFTLILCKYLEFAGFKIVIQTDLKYYSRLYTYKKVLLKQNYIFVRHISMPKNTIILRYKNKRQKITIQPCRGETILGTFDCMLPFPMHPLQVINYSTDAIKELRSSRRNLKLFFAGNADENQYARKSLENQYSVIPRFHCLRFIIEKFKKEKIINFVTDQRALYRLLENVERHAIVISEVRTEEKDWLKFLSCADFFFAAPGVEHPWCHNSIEAMAVGAIPILQYPDLFYPALEPMKNCLYYSSLNELEKVVQQALCMGNDEVCRMRENVVSYFDGYLSPEKLVNSIIAFSSSKKESLKVAIPFLQR